MVATLGVREAVIPKTLWIPLVGEDPPAIHFPYPERDLLWKRDVPPPAEDGVIHWNEHGRFLERLVPQPNFVPIQFGHFQIEM